MGKGGAGRRRGQIFVLGWKYLLQMNVRRQFWLLWCEQENRERLWGCVGEFCCWHNVSGVCLEMVRGNGIANFVCLWQLCKLLGRRFIRWMGVFFCLFFWQIQTGRSSNSQYLSTCVVLTEIWILLTSCGGNTNYNDITAIVHIIFSFLQKMIKRFVDIFMETVSACCQLWWCYWWIS